MCIFPHVILPLRPLLEAVWCLGVYTLSVPAFSLMFCKCPLSTSDRLWSLVFYTHPKDVGAFSKELSTSLILSVPFVAKGTFQDDG